MALQRGFHRASASLANSWRAAIGYLAGTYLTPIWHLTDTWQPVYDLKYRNSSKTYRPPFDLNATNTTLEALFHNDGVIKNCNDDTQVVLDGPAAKCMMAPRPNKG